MIVYKLKFSVHNCTLCALAQAKSNYVCLTVLSALRTLGTKNKNAKTIIALMSHTMLFKLIF